MLMVIIMITGSFLGMSVTTDNSTACVRRQSSIDGKLTLARSALGTRFLGFCTGAAAGRAIPAQARHRHAPYLRHGRPGVWVANPRCTRFANSQTFVEMPSRHSDSRHRKAPAANLRSRFSPFARPIFLRFPLSDKVPVFRAIADCVKPPRRST